MKKLFSLLAAALLLASSASAQIASQPIAHQGAAPPPAWDNAGHVRLCDRPNDKRSCAILKIPPGVAKGMTGIVRTKLIPDVKHGFLVAGRRDLYLCATGVEGLNQLRCQRLSSGAPTFAAATNEMTAAHLQNTITMLLAHRSPRPKTLECGEVVYDEETGELAIGSCEDDPEQGGGYGAWTDVPDPETGDTGGSVTAESMAGPG